MLLVGGEWVYQIDSLAHVYVERVERATGIEPALSAWEADVMPFHYARRWVYWASIGKRGKVANRATK